MGNVCGSDIQNDLDDDPVSNQLDDILAEEKEKFVQISRLLLLGPGESGKSTIFKQMKILYSADQFDKERQYQKNAVYNNVVTNMRSLLFAYQDLTDDNKLSSSINQKTLQDFQYSFGENDIATRKSLSESEADLILKLWNDPAMQETYGYRSSFQISDSTSYFFQAENLKRIAKPGYVPNKMDILRTRVRTSGIIEHSYKVKSSEFLVIDVGGQRTERGKWIYVFADVDAIVYVAALSGYDLKLYEDEKQNRMVEALQLFREIVNLTLFPKNTAMLLFLNKVDLFEEKIKTVDPATCHSKFADYKGGCDPEAAKEYFKQKFVSLSKGGRKVYPFFTTATDTSLMEKMFVKVREIIIRKEEEMANGTNNGAFEMEFDDE